MMRNRKIQRWIIALLTLTCCCFAAAQSDDAPFETERFEFSVGGHQLVGLLDRPEDPLATIIIVPGYGETRVLEQNAWFGLRSFFAKLGLNVLIWDKRGCGESEGEFDINQPVASSAEEVVAAVQALRSHGLTGVERIGLWGVSRAGWIAPLAMQAEPDIAFWISVSGTDDKENARYLLESNWRIEGRSEAEVELLVSEWQNGFNTAWQGGSYADYLAATTTLRDNPFMHFMGWGGSVSEADFYAYQAQFESGELRVDPETQLQIVVPDFRPLLSSIDRPVLALFGEKDTNVDWRSTAALYRETLGANPEADLTLLTFPEADHMIQLAETGGVREGRNRTEARYPPGYAESMRHWLISQGLGRR
ncbi:MAG: alpha/beta hydrolase [Pseudomonadota bacterium]